MIYALPLLVTMLLPTAPPAEAPTAPEPDADTEARTEIIFLQAMPPARAMLLFDRVIRSGPAAVIVQGRGPNVIVARDYPAQLARFRSLLAEFDRPGEADAHIYVRPVHFVVASALAQTLEGMYDSVEPPRMVADDRTGQLVVQTTLERYRALDKLIRKLDVPSKPAREPSGRPRPSPVTPYDGGTFPP
jgi:type II secretory pathway component GspD/PulD (secretin)